MTKRYIYENRPKERSKEEQAKINEQNWNEWYQNFIGTMQGAVKYIEEKEEAGYQSRKSLENGDIAFSCEEISTLQFNDDYTIARYGNKKVTFRKDGLESAMLNVLERAAHANTKTKSVKGEQLVGSLERATDVICNHKTAKNTRARINQKMQKELGITNVIQVNNSEYQLNQRYLTPYKK